MSDSVVRLAVSNSSPSKRLCTDCKHYHPDTSGWGWASRKFLWWGEDVPSAAAHYFAICSAHGGMHASSVRRYQCNNGDDWEKAAANSGTIAPTQPHQRIPSRDDRFIRRYANVENLEPND
jgi:hypothetical protein